MIRACFSQPNTSSSISSSNQVPQNVVTCIYQTKLCDSPTYLTLSWSRTISSHSLTIHVSDIFSTTISLNPSTFSFFQAQHGTKSLKNQNFKKIKLHWNFTKAEYNKNSAEPESRFYLAISHGGKLQFFLGDLALRDLTRRRHSTTTSTNTSRTEYAPVLLSRREHVFGGRNYMSRAEFLGSKHDIEIECCEGALRVKVDGEIRLVVKRLAWKFRGYEKFFIDGGVEVEFYWDVLSWVVGNDNNDNKGNEGHGVFVFQVGGGTVWPEMVAAEKRLMRKSVSDSSVLQWAEENSDCGRTSSSSSSTDVGAFSLLLYAWTINS